MGGYKFKKLESKKNRIIYQVEIEKSLQDKYKEKVYLRLSKNVKIEGFRPGKAPREMIEKSLGYDLVVKTINEMLPSITQEIIISEKLSPISSIDYDLKESKDESLIFNFSFLVRPEINISKLKKIKVEKEKVEITDKEVEEVIKNMIRAQKKDLQEKEFSLTNELVSELKFENETTVEGLKKKVLETMQKIKEEQAEKVFFSKVLEEAVKIADFEVPEELVDQEAGKKEAYFNQRLKEIKLDKNTYLKSQGIEWGKIVDGFRKDAEREIASDLILINLAANEKLVPKDSEIKEELLKTGDKSFAERMEKDNSYKEYLRTIITRDRGAKKLIELVSKKQNK